MTVKEVSDPSDKSDEVKLEVTEWPRRRSLNVPEYGCVFSEGVSRRFIKGTIPMKERW